MNVAIYTEKRKKNLPSDWLLAKKLSNQCNKGVKFAKAAYVWKQLSTHEKDPNKFLKSLDAVWSNKDQSPLSIKLIDQQIGFDFEAHCIPEVFNTHLCSVGQKIAAKYDHVIKITERYFKYNGLNLSHLTVGPKEISDLIKKH